MEPAFSLALALAYQKGGYCLLLGSGVSRAAQIPTGWEVTRDLISKVSLLYKEDCEPDPFKWYRDKFGTEADYSQLLEQLAPNPTERTAILRPYFEPTEDERERGIKVPTAAHRAIARLIRDGFVRVVITTNFDRLLETALAEEGAQPPTVVASPEAVEGALPLSHPGTHIYKLHGDYLDTRMKNTTGELASYDPRIDTQLDRILDEFGLVACGWSADWDPALRAAIERCKGRRFTTFWATVGELSSSAADLVALRGATVLRIQGADNLFSNLEANLRSLEEAKKPHPLSVAAAVGSVKRYIADDKDRIRLNDLFLDVSTDLQRKLSSASFSPDPQPRDGTTLSSYVPRYDAETDILTSMLTTATRWAESRHYKILVDTIERIGAQPRDLGGLTAFLRLRRYPAMRLVYASGLTALAVGHYKTLYTILTAPRVERKRDEYGAPVLSLYDSAVVEQAGWLSPLFNGSTLHVPVSEHLYGTLRGYLSDTLTHYDDYERIFDKFEYIYALVYASLRGRGWVPMGRLTYRFYDSRQWGPLKELEEEIATHGADWPLLQAGLCDGSHAKFIELKQRVDEFMSQNTRF